MRTFRDVTSPVSLPALAGGRQRSLLACLVWLIAGGCIPPLFASQKMHPSHKQHQVTRQPSANLKVVVRDVVVDVVVTGRKRLPVTGLKRQDFKILDDGKPQRIRSFIAHDSAVPSAVVLPKLPRLPAGLLTNYSPVPADSPLNVVLLDLENTPIQNMFLVRRQIVEFLRGQPLRARFSVFVMGSGTVTMLQGFTTDRGKLIAAVRSPEVYSLTFMPSVDPFDLYATLTPTTPQWQQDALGGAEAQLLGMPADEKVFWIDQRVRDTVNDLAKMATILSGLPGRKNLFWFTGSLPLNFDNLLQVHGSYEAGDTGPMSQLAIAGLVTMHNDPKIEQAAELLERSRTAVYAIDALGLQVGSGNPAWIKLEFAEHSTLDVVADLTGGRAFYNTNGFKQAMQTGADEGENYYTLTYVPTNVQFRGELRHIRVKLRGPSKHYHLAYRHSYYANSSDAAPEQPPPPLAFTLQHGAPQSQQILFWASLQKVGEPHPAASSRTGSPAPSRPTHEPNVPARARSRRPEMLRTLVIHCLLVTRMLSMAHAKDGEHRVKLELAVRAFGENGSVLQTVFNQLQATLSSENYRLAEKRGLRVDQKVTVPAETAFLRLAVRDDLSNHVGSLEIPLPPLPKVLRKTR